MIKLIDKNTYLAYLVCAKNAWLKFNKFDELRTFFEAAESEKSGAFKARIVKQQAWKLFPNGVFIELSDKMDAALETQRHMEMKTQILFKATFVYKTFLVVADVLVYDNQRECWNLYGISSKSGLDDKKKQKEKEEIVSGLTFQAITLKALGIELGEISIIYLNKDYVRDEIIDLEQLFCTMKVSSEVSDKESTVSQQMFEISDVLLSDDCTELTCECIYKGRSNHCPTFSWSHSYVPAYSIHDLTRIGSSKKTLAALVDAGVFKINEISDDIKLTGSQKNQVHVYKQQKPLIDYEAINKELATLTYPLYFFDYETYSPAIPMFNGFSPYKNIQVQFSLHIVYDQHTEPVHCEYLHEATNDPSLNIIQKLQEFIGSSGTIIAWYKSFERTQNSELAVRHPEFKEFLDDINNRIYDLMDIFQKQMYVDVEFKGSSSIKNVLPVLAPEFSYKNLAIQNGQDATQKWFDMVHGGVTIEEKQKIAQDLRKYCALDTYAMYAIWRQLINTCNVSHGIAQEACTENMPIK